MSHAALADFLELLAQEGELARVAVEVDPVLELAAVVDRTARSGGPALLFQRVRGVPSAQSLVAANLLGSVPRICLALGVTSVAEFAARLEQTSAAGAKPSWLERLTSRGTNAAVARCLPKSVKAGPVQQVVKLGRDVDLQALPALRLWPGEKVKTITAGLVQSIDPETAQAKLSPLTLPILDQQQLGLAWHPFVPIWHQAAVAKARGEKLPVAISLGGSPALAVWSRLPLPACANLLELVGAWTGTPLSVVRCRTQPLDVPAEAEWIIEGYLDPAEPAVPVPTFTTSGGQYAVGYACQPVHVTALTHRTGAIWPAMVSAPHESELSSLGRFAEQLLLAELRPSLPELVDLALPHYGATGQLILAAVRKPYPGAARRVAHALWGHPALMLAKLLVLVDEEVRVQDSAEVWRQVAAWADPQTDISPTDGPRDPFACHTASTDLGSKLTIDATTKPDRSPAAGLGLPQAAAETLAQVGQRWAEYGLEPKGEGKPKAAARRSR